ncbi:hypothetical protein ACP4OV_011149 [Aristida adscensionis]
MPTPGSAALGAEEPRSASAIVAGAVTGHHLLHVEGYSRTKDKLPTGKSISSHPFTAGGRRWYISYYPNGNSSEYADSISVFLFLQESASGPVKARAKFGLLDRTGKSVNTRTTGPRHFSPVGSGFDFPDFISTEVLDKSDHLLDDCIKITCDISISEELRTEDRIAAPSFLELAVPPSDLNRHLGDLLVTQEGADVTFQVAGEAFRAHRFLLGARSPVFKAQLFGGLKESTGSKEECIQIDDMSPQVFKALLHFVYTDSLLEVEGQDDAAMAQHLLEAADRYDMQRLKLICEDRLCRQLDVSTAATTLVLAEQHSCKGLKEACIEFLKSPGTLDAVMETDAFEHLTRSSPGLMKELMSKLVSCLYKRPKLGA